MRDEMGAPNFDTGMGTEEEYKTSFYTHFTQEIGVEISDEDKIGLEPLIAQAHSKGIATMALVEIVKQGM